MDEPFGGLIEAFGQDTWPADFLVGLFTLAFIITAYVVLRRAGNALTDARARLGEERNMPREKQM